MKLRTLPLTLALMTAFAGTAQAQSLSTLYQAAKGHDATFKAVRSQYEAALAKAEQAKALLRPTAGLGGNLSESNLDNQSNAMGSGAFGTRSLSVNGSHPLYRPANLASFAQGMKQVDLAQAQLKAAEQELMVRTSQAYFDVLTAQESLSFVKAQKTAVSEQLAAAKRNFEVGTATITDTREAQARFDLVTAQEIAADNDLQVKRLALDQTVGIAQIKPLGLQAAADIARLHSGTIDSWVAQSDASNTSLTQARIALEVAQLEIDKAKAALKPTVDLNASYGMTPATATARSLKPNTNTATIGVALNMPLYTGQASQNRILETLALQDKARNELDAAQRNVAQATRTAFLWRAIGPEPDHGPASGRSLQPKRLGRQQTGLPGGRAHQHRRAQQPKPAVPDQTRPGQSPSRCAAGPVAAAPVQRHFARRRFAGGQRLAAKISGIALPPGTTKFLASQVASASEQSGNGLGIALGRAPALGHQIQPFLAGLRQFLRLSQPSHRLVQRTVHVADANCSPRLLGVLGGLSKIEGVRPHDDRAAKGGRLNQVLPTQRHETAAQQGHVGALKIHRHLAQAVAQQNGHLVGLGRGWGPSPSSERRCNAEQALPLALTACVNFFKALRVPGHQQPEHTRSRPERLFKRSGLAAKASSHSASSPSRVLASMTTGRGRATQLPLLTAKLAQCQRLRVGLAHRT
jgi:outer membrane protein